MATAEQPARGFFQIRQLKSVGEYRDAVLVSASLIYILGYLSWAFHAGENQLGMVPALDAQYLVAGILPAMIFMAGVALAAVQLQIGKWAFTEPTDTRYRWGTLISTGAMLIIVVGAISAALLERLQKPGAENIAMIFVGFAAYVLMGGSLLQGARGPAFLRAYALGVLWLVVLFIPIILMLFYFERVFPRLPTALGGPAPQCVAVDVAPGELSPTTMAALAPATGIKAAQPVDSMRVVRTRPLELLFSGPDFVILRVQGQPKNAPVYSVSKRAIVVLETCPTAKPA